jgi:GH15 family glucan-1,4-alpha-glucosidase
MNDFGLDLAVIGNGRTAALLEPSGRLVWWCFPRFDSDPVFCRLLAGDEEKGFCDVVLDDMIDFSSDYVRNTAVVTTVLTDRKGAAIRITDFAPRFRAYDRTFRPPQLVRIIEPVAGLPRVTIRFRPTNRYGIAIPFKSIGSNHITFRGTDTVIRLTTDAPLSYIDREAPFVVTRPLYLVMGPDEPFPADLSTTCREFADRTRDYWTEWVRRLSIA